MFAMIALAILAQAQTDAPPDLLDAPLSDAGGFTMPGITEPNHPPTSAMRF